VTWQQQQQQQQQTSLVGNPSLKFAEMTSSVTDYTSGGTVTVTWQKAYLQAPTCNTTLSAG
jgi:hypothetical protein